MGDGARLTDGLKTPPVPQKESWWNMLEDRHAEIGALRSTLPLDFLSVSAQRSLLYESNTLP